MLNPYNKIFNATGRGKMQREWNHNEFRILMHYQNLTMNRFRWENLPDGIESRHIEQALYLNGTAVFFKQKYTNKFRCLPAFGKGDPDIYGDWQSYDAFGYNGIKETMKADKCVPCFENDTRYPLVNSVYYFANLIAEIDRTIHINTKQQRRPYIISTTKDMELSARRFMEKLEQDEYVLQDKGLSGKRKDDLTIEVLQTKSEFLIDKLNDAKHELENDFLDIIGINNNANTDKKERLLVDEINSNNEYIDNNLDIAYKCRLEFQKKVNEKFGLNIRVVKVKDIIDKENTEKEIEKERKKNDATSEGNDRT